jgi:hypothetical protein
MAAAVAVAANPGARHRGRAHRGGAVSLRDEALRLRAELGGRAIVVDASNGWPAAVAFRLDGAEPAYEWPCPYGNFAWVRSNEAAVDDYRDLLTLATVEPEHFR